MKLSEIINDIVDRKIELVTKADFLDASAIQTIHEELKMLNNELDIVETWERTSL